MYLKILFIVWLIDAAFAKNFHWEVTLDVENSCGNPGGPGNAKPLLLKGIRLVVFEKDGNAGWGKVVATLVQIPKMKGQAEGNDDRRMGFPLNIMIPADNVYDEKKEAAQIVCNSFIHFYIKPWPFFGLARAFSNGALR